MKCIVYLLQYVDKGHAIKLGMQLKEKMTIPGYNLRILNRPINDEKIKYCLEEALQVYETTGKDGFAVLNLIEHPELAKTYNSIARFINICPQVIACPVPDQNKFRYIWCYP